MTPTELSEQLLVKSHDFSTLSEELGQILVQKPDWWNLHRAGHTSDKQCEQAWNATESGKRETIIRLKVRSLEKEMSAIRTRLKIMSDEARNMY